jgi:hypothetical protein
MTKEGDVVLVHIDNTPAFFARVESISPDVKPDWFHAKLLVLQVPPLLVTWILRPSYIDGAEFTMGGRPMRLEKVVAPETETVVDTFSSGEEEPEVEAEKDRKAPEGPAGKVVSIFDRRKKDHSS